MILRGVIVANCMSDQIPGAMLLGTLLNETHLHHLRPEVVTVDVIVYTFDTDDEAALADGGSCGVEGHGDVTAGVDDDRLFAESSTFAQMNHLRHHVLLSVAAVLMLANSLSTGARYTHHHHHHHHY